MYEAFLSKWFIQDISVHEVFPSGGDILEQSLITNGKQELKARSCGWWKLSKTVQAQKDGIKNSDM